MRCIVRDIKENYAVCREFKIYPRKLKISKDMLPEDIRKDDVIYLNEEGTYSIDLRKSIDANLFDVGIILLTIIFILMGVIYSNIIVPMFTKPLVITKDNYKTNQNIKELDELLNVNADDLHVKIVKVKGFDLRNNTLSFKNIGTKSSEFGNCFGMVYLEKMLFSDKLKLVEPGDDNVPGYDLTGIKKELGVYTLDDESTKGLYVRPDEKFIAAKEMRLVEPKRKVEKKTAEELYHDHFYNEQENFKDIQQPDIKRILQAINYLQVKRPEVKSKFAVNFSTYSNVAVYMGDLKKMKSPMNLMKTSGKLKDELSITDIESVIDNDELILLAIFNGKTGHALLGYAYEYIDKDTFKLYVSDPNFPLFPDEDKYRGLNNDIENLYVLFKNTSGKWQYKYDPSINNVILYNGAYNSYMPDSGIEIY